MEMTEKKVDRRVLKTKKAIRNAFAELLAVKDMNLITVKDIADTADINRKTFYNYYSGIYQIVDEIENEIVTAFEKALIDVDFHRDMQNPCVLFAKLTSILSSDLQFYSCLLKIDRPSSLLSKIITALKERIKQSFAQQIPLDAARINLAADFCIYGMFAVYQNWFNSDRSIPIEELSQDISILTFYGLNGLVQDQ